MFRRIVAFTVVAVSVSAVSLPALAGCRISNRTKWSFTIESGNTSNQRVGANTTTSIAAGKIKGKSKEGKTISGSCKDGDELIVTDEGGIPVLELK